MKCLNCGENVKFEANICPRCHSSNSANQKAGCATLLVAMPIGFLVGSQRATYQESWIWGISTFCVIYVLILAIGMNSYQKSNKKRDLL